MNEGPYGQDIASNSEFLRNREIQIVQMGEDEALRAQAIDLQVAATHHGYGYQQLWCGVPVIRLPDDIVLLQEMVHALRPHCIVETGVARGGSLLLNASLMDIAGIQPRVLGIDIQILEHARRAISESRYANQIELLEADSTSLETGKKVDDFLSRYSLGSPALLILDSSHAHAHVLGELRLLTQVLPTSSIVIVADTIIADMPPELYANRPWSATNNPLTALKEFLSENFNFTLHANWSRRGLVSELRDGIIVRIS